MDISRHPQPPPDPGRIDPSGVIVSILGRPSFREQVERHVEAVLSWQCVGDSTAVVGLSPSLVLVDSSVEADSLPSGVPVVLLIEERLEASAAARRAVALNAWRVLEWPLERDALPSLPGSVPRPVGPAPGRTMRVAGAGGGVGTTTVALALGGLSAWAGQSVLAVLSGDVPCGEVPVIDDVNLDGPGTWGAASPVVGVPGLRAVRRSWLGSGARLLHHDSGPLAVPDGVRVVLDLGVAPEVADVLVLRRDRAGRDAVRRSPAGALVLLDDGSLSESDALTYVGNRMVAVVPYSARVARAAVKGRVPTDLPGSWLMPLRGLVP